MTRRQALSLLALTSLPGRAQQNRGMASRGLKPLPFGKPSGRPWDARFVNVAFSAGLRSPVVYGPVDHNDYVVESMGCGAAFLDYDNDGWQDIVQLTGRRLESTPAGAIIRLYRNNRDGTFADVTGKSGLGQSVWASGITVADYDNDGYDDLFITCWGQNLLFHNNGDGTFTDVTAKAGLIHPGIRYGTGCTWIDYDRDGKLDLFVCHYLVFDQEKIPVRGKDPGCSYLGVPVYCGPAGLPQESCRLYHNNGDGTFTDVSRESGISAVKAGYALTAAAADFDGDGWPDIYVACDTSPSLLFRNNHDGTFTEEGLERGVALNDDGQEQAGMGLGHARAGVDRGENEEGLKHDRVVIPIPDQPVHAGKAAEDLRHAHGERNRAAGAPGEILAHFARDQIQIHRVQPRVGENAGRAVDGEVIAGVHRSRRD